MDLVREVETLFVALERENAPYALAGGLALAVHGIVRATADIDLLVPRSAVSWVSSIVQALGYRGPESLRFANGCEIARFVKFVGEESLLLDLLVAEGALEEPFETRIRVALGETSFWVVSREGLKAMKLFAAREIDLQDVRRLVELDG